MIQAAKRDISEGNRPAGVRFHGMDGSPTFGVEDYIKPVGRIVCCKNESNDGFARLQGGPWRCDQ
ncbi:MAG: hypothetical protein P8J27_13245 [Mariniblastus sp.]|nr:hypothetical protein [Mariniblastus sp.]